MKAFTKGDVIRCMQKALARLDKRKDEPQYRSEFRDGFQYYYLLEATLEFLAEEEPNLKPNDGRYQDIVHREASRGPLSISLMEGYWYLVSNGYIVQGANGVNPPNFSQLRITDLGREWALNSDTSPEDQQGYLAALKVLVNPLDSVIEQYTKEAVAAFARQMYFAAAVMIGAASEKLVYQLMDALVASIADPKEQAAIKKTINERGLPSMFAKLQHKLSEVKAKKLIPWSITEGADTHLLSLQDAVRVQRNDAVHPLAGKVTPQTVRLSLASFPGACRKVYDLIGWFQANKI